MAPYEEIKTYLNIGPSCKKLFKHAIFQKYIKGDVKVPYRYIYPDARESEWKCKNKNPTGHGASGILSPEGEREKSVRVLSRKKMS